jgi:hypothetical protein
MPENQPKPGTTPPPVFHCPLCSSPWRGGSPSCWRCGADLSDPDVQAFVTAQREAAAAGTPLTNPSLDAEELGAGALGAGKHLGATVETLHDGRALRRLGFVGGLMALIGFAMPALRLWEVVPPERWGDDPTVRGYYKFSWELWSSGHAVALAWPFLAGLLGLAAALTPRLPAIWRAGLLAFAGLGGLALSLGPLGEYGMAPTKMLTLTTLALVVGGVAMAGRMLWPQSMPARWGLVAASALFLLGLVIPVADVTGRLPYDYAFYADALEIDFSDVMPLSAIAAGVDKRVAILFFVSLFMLLPLVALPAAAAVSWKRPQGVWDKPGLALRPLAWLLAFYLPLLYGLMAFSATGWDDQLSQSALIGRLRLTLLAIPFFVWAQMGLVGVVSLAHAARRPKSA